MMENRRIWSEMASENSIWGMDLDPAPNFDPDALVMVPDPKNLVFEPKL